MTATPSTVPSSRFHFVDLLRGWAVFVMIETHVVNALLIPSIKEEQIFRFLTFFNGLVAPSFLFCAGFGFAISFNRKWKDFISFQPGLWRYLKRLGFILFIAYSLHIPFFSLRQMMALTDEQSWMIFFQSDILHVISLTMISLVILALIIRDERIFIYVASFIGIVIVMISPVIRSMDHTQMPIWFRPYLSLQFKSQFPLFPWAAFLIGGVIVGYAFLQARKSNRERTLVNRLMALSIVGAGLALLIEYQPLTLYPNHNFWNASPEFFVVRFAVVVLLCVILWHYAEKKEGTGRSLLTMFGQESLLVYVAHLLIVYGYTFEWSFIRVFDSTLNYWQCFGLTILLIGVMYLLAYGWHELKIKSIRTAKLVQYGVILGTAVYFVMK